MKNKDKIPAYSVRILLFTAMMIVNTIVLSGCWNYREVDKMAIVAGVAIDIGTDSLYKTTVEVLRISGGSEAKPTSQLITVEGKTIFDAVRNEIALSGKKLYWSHCKLAIIGKDVATEGIAKIIDFFSRDAETRQDIHIMICKDGYASDIFRGQATTEDITSFELDDMIKNQSSLSKAPTTELWEFIDCLAGKGKEATAPVVQLTNIGGGKKPNIIGMAIFKKDRLLGFLDGDETKKVLFVKDKIKGGVLNENIEKKAGKKEAPAALEIFKNKTKLDPVIINGGNEENNIEFDVSTETVTSIYEIDGSTNYITEEGKRKLEREAEDKLKIEIEAMIKKIQSEYGSDIFGFGAKLREVRPEIWKMKEGNWENTFKNLKVNVKTKVQIKNSAMMSKPLEVVE